MFPMNHSYNPKSKVNNCKMQARYLPLLVIKDIHNHYMNFFRVHQCQLYVEGRCPHSYPFSCFFWHTPNQRRRRVTILRDGTFNYSPMHYCMRYNRSNGFCPDGDGCRLLHLTFDDAERKYHPRHFKTMPCPYSKDMLGECMIYGKNCPSSHGPLDHRPPTIDITEPRGIIGPLHHL